MESLANKTHFRQSMIIDKMIKFGKKFFIYYIVLTSDF